MLKSIFIEAREWFDKSGGNSYWSAQIQVDGQLVITIPMTYGYESAYITGSLQALQEAGYIPKRNLWELDRTKYHLYNTKYKTTKKEMYTCNIA